MADYSAEDFKPTAHGNKHQEMAVRRAYVLNAALIDVLQLEGTVSKIKDLWRTAIIEHKDLRDLFWNKGSATPEWKYRDVWEWTVDHWYSGALKRSVDTSMHNMHSKNVQAIKGKIDELYG